MVSSDYYVEDNSDLENKKLEAAKNLYGKGKYNEALNLYLGMLNMSTSYKLYYEIGRCYYKLNNLLASEEYFKKSIGLENSRNSSYLYLGNIFFKRKDLKNAIENWSHYYAYKPDDEAVCLNLATSYFTKGMKFQAFFFYDKYLKYAKDRGNSYNTIKQSIDKCKSTALEFMQRGQIALNMANNKGAIEYLEFAEKNFPTNFDINYLLGRTYLNEKDSMHAMIYLKQAMCLDDKSLDVLHKLTSVFINLGDYTAAYCTLRRIAPLVLNKQSEYLKAMKTIEELDASFDELSYKGHKEWADRYFENNNYHLALIEYENCLILNHNLKDKLEERILLLKSFINPEERIINNCLQKGRTLYANGDVQTAKKYFSKILLLSNENSPEYKLAKTRVADV